MSLTKKIRLLLEEKRIPYTEIDHDAATTCEESAAERGEDMAIGGKTILFKDKKDFRLFVISAARQIDSNKVRQILGSQRLRFATPEELMDLAGVEKGALPPFGNPILPYDLYVDESIMKNEKIAFNAGLLTKSFIMAREDWFRLVDATICKFAK